jgi:hypothetical protein
MARYVFPLVKGPAISDALALKKDAKTYFHFLCIRNDLRVEVNSSKNYFLAKHAFADQQRK